MLIQFFFIYSYFLYSCANPRSYNSDGVTFSVSSTSPTTIMAVFLISDSAALDAILSRVPRTIFSSGHETCLTTATGVSLV